LLWFKHLRGTTGMLRCAQHDRFEFFHTFKVLGKMAPPPFVPPPQLGGGGGRGEGPHPGPTACAVGHIMTPVGSRADFFNELLTQDTTKQSLLTPSGEFFVYLWRPLRLRNRGLGTDQSLQNGFFLR
jgi:hypothetical protein